MATYNNTTSALPNGTLLRSATTTYKIVRTLGQGSFGITYLAEMNNDGTATASTAAVYVTVKEFFMSKINGRKGTAVTNSDAEGFFDYYKKRFIKEAQNLKSLNHEHIVKVAEAFECNGTAYYAMEYIDGETLSGLISRKGRLREQEAIDITLQVADALSYMHNRKMLHLDLKPSNIMMRSGEAVLIDFGLSKQFNQSGEPESSTTIGLGTPGYAPIEQANYHEHSGLPATLDIYALGATMMKMLTGVGEMPTASDILNDGFPFGLFAQAGISEKTTAVVNKAMAPMSKARYQTVEELAQALSGKTRNDNEETEIRSNEKKTSFGRIVSTLLTIVICIVIGALVLNYAVGSCNGSEGRDDTAAVDAQTTSDSGKTEQATSPKAVDLGLPSRTLWADRNLGAADIHSDGPQYAFGTTVSKDDYPMNTGEEFDGEESIIGTSHDVATQKLGEAWQLPSKEQFEELINVCSCKSVSGGYEFTGPNGKTLFFPVSKGEDGNGYYWSGEKGCVLELQDVNQETPTISVQYNFAAYCGLSIRPVRQMRSHAVYGLE